MLASGTLKVLKAARKALLTTLMLASGTLKVLKAVRSFRAGGRAHFFPSLNRISPNLEQAQAVLSFKTKSAAQKTYGKAMPRGYTGPRIGV